MLAIYFHYYELKYCTENSMDPDQLLSSEASRSGSALLHFKRVNISGFPPSWKMDKMNSMHGKIMEFDILKKNLEKSWNLKKLDHGKLWNFEKS